MSIEKVKSYFKQFNMEDKIMEFPVSIFFSIINTNIVK